MAMLYGQMFNTTGWSMKGCGLPVGVDELVAAPLEIVRRIEKCQRMSVEAELRARATASTSSDQVHFHVAHTTSM